MSKLHCAGGVQAKVSRAAWQHHLGIPVQSKRIEMPVLKMAFEQGRRFKFEVQLVPVESNCDLPYITSVYVPA